MEKTAFTRIIIESRRKIEIREVGREGEGGRRNVLSSQSAFLNEKVSRER